MLMSKTHSESQLRQNHTFEQTIKKFGNLDILSHYIRKRREGEGEGGG